MLNAAQLVKHVNDQEKEVRVSLLLLVCKVCVEELHHNL